MQESVLTSIVSESPVIPNSLAEHVWHLSDGGDNSTYDLALKFTGANERESSWKRKVQRELRAP